LKYNIYQRPWRKRGGSKLSWTLSSRLRKRRGKGSRMKKGGRLKKSAGKRRRPDSRSNR
jgi:hypothetical protein